MIEDINEDTSTILVTPTKVSSQSDQSEDHLKVLSAAKVLADAARKRKEVANVTPYTRRKRSVSTSKEPVSTAGASKPVSTVDMVQERVKDKGKAIMQESEQPRKIKKKGYQQISLDEEIAQKPYVEELTKDKARQKQERYHALQNRSFFVAEVRKNMCLYLKNQEKGSEKKARGSKKKTLAKKEKEELRMWLTVVPDEEEAIDPEILSARYPIVDWESQNSGSDLHVYKIIRAGRNTSYHKTFSSMLRKLDRQDLMDLYRLVMNRFENTTPEGYSLILWGDLKLQYVNGEKVSSYQGDAAEDVELEARN
ncbi:hypothetical protein Tco_0718579 [Tanacetum coccineum]